LIEEATHGGAMKNPFNIQYSEEDLERAKQQLIDDVRPHVHGEEVVTAGRFRRGGFGASYAASKAGGGLAYAAVNLARKKKAGGLPQHVALVLTPTHLYALELKPKGRGLQVKREAAVWDRAALRVSTEESMGCTMLTLESPSEGEKATLAPAGVKDDPWTLSVIREIESGVAPAA
jgi:hypothetical protein